MRTATKRTDVYTFDELSESAKETAMQWYREGAFDYEWWDFEDAKQIGKIIGIDIDNIFFSGFSSQGDGACFEGSYAYKIGSVKNLKEYAPLDKTLHQIALDLSKAQRKRFYQLSANVKQSGHYMHEMCTDITVFDHTDEFHTLHADAVSDDSITEPLRDFMRWIYKQLESEYDYLNSDKAVKESIEANEYEFDEYGNIY